MAAALAVNFAFVCAASAQPMVPGYPQRVEEMDPREVALLPNYCRYTQLFRDHLPGGGDQSLVKSWYAELGPTFHHLHHYCLGLMKTNRAVLLARDPSVRSFYLNDAITEFDYVITRAEPGFVLLPEMLTKKGENLIQLDKGPMAVYEFERAIDAKKDYWPPYADLSDYYKGVGNFSKAREVLHAGLAQAPNSQALRRRLTEMASASDHQDGKR